jgi:hypothetical protein
MDIPYWMELSLAGHDYGFTELYRHVNSVRPSCLDAYLVA